MNTALNLQAREIATRAAGHVGFDPISLITILLPLVIGCFKKSSTETPKAFLKDHYDASTDTFDSSIINRVRPQTKRAARQDGKRHLSRQQLDAITVATLKRAMEEDESNVASCMADADPMSGVDE